MTALLAGIDWSSRALHAALIPIDPDHDDPTCPPVTFRVEDLPRPGGDPVHRIRAVQHHTRELLRSPSCGDNISWIASVWIEEAFGRYRNADRTLLPIYGAIIAGVAPHIAVSSLSAVQWRKELGLKLGATSTAEAKAEAQTLVLDWLSDHTPPRLVDGTPTKAFAMPDEHEVDALCIALAARRILHRSVPDAA